jgi:hypothetical protein
MKSRLILAMGAATALSVVLFFVASVELPSGPACAASPMAPKVSFSEDVLPLLKFRCPACHTPGGEGYEKSGFDLSSYDTLMKGTKFGPMVIAGDPDSSNLMRLLDWRVSPEIRMPHGKKQMSICDRDQIRAWIMEGAKNN